MSVKSAASRVSDELWATNPFSSWFFHSRRPSNLSLEFPRQRRVQTVERTRRRCGDEMLRETRFATPVGSTKRQDAPLGQCQRMPKAQRARV